MGILSMSKISISPSVIMENMYIIIIIPRSFSPYIFYQLRHLYAFIIAILILYWKLTLKHHLYTIFLNCRECDEMILLPNKFIHRIFSIFVLGHCLKSIKLDFSYNYSFHN